MSMHRIRIVVVQLLSCVWLLVTLWTIAHQTPLFMGFSRQEYRSGLPFPTPGDPDPGIEPTSLMSFALAGEFFITSATQEAHLTHSSVCQSQTLNPYPASSSPWPVWFDCRIVKGAAGDQDTVILKLLNSSFLLLWIQEKNQQVRQGIICIQWRISQELG